MASMSYANHIIYVQSFSSFYSKLGLEVVTITVGSGEAAKKYVIHKNVLCSKSEFFQKMFSNGFLESTELVAHLPEDHPETFEVFLGWIYRDIIEPSPGKETFQYRRLFFFAEKYNMVTLMDLVMDKMVEFHKQNNNMLSIHLIDLVYKQTHQTSRFRLYAARTLAFKTLNFPPGVAEGNSNIKIQEVVSKHSDLLLDFLNLIRGTGGVKFPNPSHAPLCDYHQHGMNENCPYNSISSTERVVAKK